jgi:hypothetical protein
MKNEKRASVMARKSVWADNTWPKKQLRFVIENHLSDRNVRSDIVSNIRKQ